MALPQFQQIRRKRRSLVLSLSLVVVALGTALVLIAYPWDAIAVHGVSLRHMLTAIAPLALLSVLTILFLASVVKDFFSAEDAEEGLLAVQPVDLEEILGKLGRALEIEGRLAPADGASPVLCDPLLAEAALAALLEDAARTPGFGAALAAEEGAVHLDVKREGPASGAAQVAANALQRAGVAVQRTEEGWRLTFPAAEQSP